MHCYPCKQAIYIFTPCFFSLFNCSFHDIINVGGLLMVIVNNLPSLESMDVILVCVCIWLLCTSVEDMMSSAHASKSTISQLSKQKQQFNIKTHYPFVLQYNIALVIIIMIFWKKAFLKSTKFSNMWCWDLSLFLNGRDTLITYHSSFQCKTMMDQEVGGGVVEGEGEFVQNI